MLKIKAELSRRSAIRPIDDHHAAGGSLVDLPEFTESDIDCDSEDEDEDGEGEGHDEERDKLSEYEWRYGPLCHSNEWEGLGGSDFEHEDDPMADAPGTTAAPEATTAPPPDRHRSSDSSIEELPPPYNAAQAGSSASKPTPKPVPKPTPKSTPKSAPKSAPKPTPKSVPPPKKSAPTPAPKSIPTSASIPEPFPTSTRKKLSVKVQPSAASTSTPVAKAVQPTTTPKAEPSKGKGKARKESSSEVEYLPSPLTSKKRKVAADEDYGEASNLMHKANKAFDSKTQEDAIRQHMEGTFFNSSMF
ncbi:hypothetical protein FS749_010563 [Ceratobasidium sp. UAMH 11750]|nr:hypothetical protein FS749_010563 [Ceratobasidium sp. UAMH 11750]